MTSSELIKQLQQYPEDSRVSVCVIKCDLLKPKLYTVFWEKYNHVAITSIQGEPK